MINKDSNLSLDKICRSCMTEANQMRSVYDTNTESVQLAEMIMACASVQVISGDGLPTLICPKCEEQLSVAYLFKQQCERTDTTLREYTNQHTPIKEESESLDIVVKPDIDVLEIYDDDEDEDEDDDDDDDDGRDDDDDAYSGSESQHSNYSTTVRRKKKPAKNRQCRFCNKMLSTKEGLRLHERRHTGEKLKSCPVCHATFAKSNHLIRHMQMHNKPTDEYKHTCQECGMGFTKASHLLKHKKEHKQQSSSSAGNKDVDTKVGATSAAGAGADDEEMTLVKREVDSDEDDGDDLMNMSSTSNRPKLRPKKEPNDPDKLHPCKVCNKVLTTSAGLQIHMRRHTGNNLSTCYICRKSFTKTSHLNRHMLTHGVTPQKGGGVKDKSNEPKEKKYMACEFCDRKFVYRKSFLHHIQLEHQISEDSDTPLSEYATIITKSTGKLDTSNSSELLENGSGDVKTDGQLPDEFEEFMRQEEAKKVHVCHVCNHRFTRANHLTRHMTLHRAVLAHKCDRCEKAFMTPEHLATHVQDYHVDRPYVCSLCNKPFSRGEHLIRHLKVHDKDTATSAAAGGDKEQQQHKCSICEKVFARSDHLARHTKLHLAQDKRHSGQLKAHRRSQGHWLETQPELKGAHRVTPVTPLVNPPPIKFKTRVQRIKEEPSILGHTIGITTAGGVAVVGIVKPDEQQHQQSGIVSEGYTYQSYG
ncbi:crooked legs [Carabus blaptoides fortunei]